MYIWETDLRDHETGDIILSKNPDKFGKLNIIYQNKVSGKKSNYTHVYLCVDKGVFVEATVSKKIELFPYDADRTSIKSAEWTVYRNSLLENNAKLKEELKNKILYHLGKGYDGYSLLSYGASELINIKTPLNNDVKNPKAYCSDFVCMVFKEINYELNCNLFNSDPKKVLPVHIEHLIYDDQNWRKIEYQKLNNNEEIKEELENLHRILDEDKVREKMVDEFKKVQIKNVELLYTYNKISEIIDKSVSNKDVKEEFVKTLKKNKSLTKSEVAEMKEDTTNFFESLYNSLTNGLQEPKINIDHFTLNKSLKEHHEELKKFDESVNNQIASYILDCAQYLIYAANLHNYLNSISIEELEREYEINETAITNLNIILPKVSHCKDVYFFEKVINEQHSVNQNHELYQFFLEWCKLATYVCRKDIVAFFSDLQSSLQE